MNNSGVGSWSFPPADGSTIPRTVQFTPRLLVNSVRAAVVSAVEGRRVSFYLFARGADTLARHEPRVA